MNTINKMVKINWTQTNEYIDGITSKFKYTNKIAMFDLDSTLVEKKSGKHKKMPIDENDWIFLYDNVAKKIRELEKNGYTIIINSNQSGLDGNSFKQEQWKKKLEMICSELKVEIRIFCSTGKNRYRKPSSLFFREIVKNNDISKAESFYCGDACGRKGDHSDCDLKFAINCELKFYTPEELFKNEKSEFPQIKYCDFGTAKQFDFTKFTPQEKEMIIMIGYPASGKSYVATELNRLYNYDIINRDTLKTKEKCIAKATEYLSKNKCIIIDNTNPSKEDRKQFIDIAKKHGYKIRAIHMMTSYELSMHRSHYRNIKTDGKTAPIPEVVYRIYRKNFVEPDMSEGISEIIEIEPPIIDDPVYKEYMY